MFRVAAALAVTCGVLVGCESPVPFYRPGQGSPDGPAIGLGGPAPYLPPRPESVPPAVPVPAGRVATSRLYVAHGRVIDVLDPGTLQVMERVRAGAAAARIVPSSDSRRLWVVDRAHGVLVAVGVDGGERGRPVRVKGAAGLYFTRDGRDALVLSPRRLGVRDPVTMRARAAVPLPCAAGHADFTADGSALVATCPSAGTLVRVDLTGRRVTGTIRLPRGARPGDLRSAPGGAVFHVADPAAGGLWVVDARRFVPLGFVPTEPGARSLVVGGDGRRVFVVGGDVLAVVDVGGGRVVSRWPLPGRGPATPGGLSPDGSALWLADPGGLVYAVSTRTGSVLRKVDVGGRPAALCLQPGS
ncbi:hypothetical protein D0T12_06985 [Actinomadura spongiicola]|uniref:YncE family protein n=1 Tax=Actinomadura spongiicola TaxID=2303421 RepID=A0A372GLV4_9ACTN|nr:hypothetical protein D0T12_06985 [Actinomadura spongiicola]